MKVLFLLASVCLLFHIKTAAVSDQTNPQPVWSLDLQEKLGLHTFQSEPGPTWSKQHDVVFLAPERVLLYQVDKLREPARLAGRNTSGGAGNFVLEVRILDVRDGRLVKTLLLPTSAGFSKIIPTNDGKLIVRTGDSLFLCRQDFQTIVSRTLPIQGEAPIDAWQIGLSPSGRQLALVHQKIKPGFLGPDQTEGGWAQSEIEILDPDTFKTLRTFTIPHALSSWSLGEGTLITANPAPASGAPRFGFLDFSGKWSPWELRNDSCAYQIEAFDQGYVAAYGCGKISVLDASREKIFSHDVGGRFSVGSAGLAGKYFAVEIVREVQSTLPGTNFPVIMPQSERLEVFDITTKQKILSVPARSESLYYEISATGSLVVVDGANVSLYRIDQPAK